jgi:hypothetical protein
MDEKEISQLFAALGSRGGRARAAKLSAKRRKEIAIKASKAAAKKRMAKGKTKL